jgi:primosomal protein N'
MAQGFADVSAIGPILPYYAMQDGMHKRILLLRYKNRQQMDDYLHEALPRLNGLSGVKITVNVDPLDY